MGDGSWGVGVGRGRHSPVTQLQSKTLACSQIEFWMYEYIGLTYVNADSIVTMFIETPSFVDYFPFILIIFFGTINYYFKRRLLETFMLL